LFLTATDPNLIAHAGIASADLPLAATFFCAHYALYRLLAAEARAGIWVVASALACAAAITVKYTGLLVIPSLAAIAVTWIALAPRTAAEALGRSRSACRRLWLRRVALAGLAALFATYLLSAALYRRWDPHVPYVAGIRLLYANLDPQHAFYLLGKFSNESWPHYYVVATLLKTPAITLALLAAAMWPRSGRALRWHEQLLLWIPVLLVHVVASQDRANLGLRRVLLVYPFLFLAVGRLLERWTPSTAPRSLIAPPRRPAIALALACVLIVINALAIHPDQLGYIARWAGGPAAGPLYLDDSNIDWGQDLPRLATYQREHGTGELRYLGPSLEKTRYHGIECRSIEMSDLLDPQPAVYAIGAHDLARLAWHAQRTGREEVDWLRARPVTTRVGSIWIFDLR
jgi:hypothetical protein